MSTVSSEKEAGVGMSTGIDEAVEPAKLAGAPVAAKRGAGQGAFATWAERVALPFVWLLLGGSFALADPSHFLTSANLANVFGSQAVLFVLTMAVLLPLLAGDFDLSLGSLSALVSMSVAILNAEDHLGIVLSCVIGLGIGIVGGMVNALLVVIFDTDSFIVTLGTGSAYTGLVYAISSSNTISGISNGLITWTYTKEILGIPIEFYYGLGVMLVLWVVMELTPLGQWMLFVGQSRDVARLSGIRVTMVRFITFSAGGLIAAMAGILYIGTTGSADPIAASSLLLAAFAAAFLGATSIKPGRFNAIGAAIAVFFLSTGVVGLQLLGVADFVQQLFYGGALVIAVVLSRMLRKRAYGI